MWLRAAQTAVALWRENEGLQRILILSTCDTITSVQHFKTLYVFVLLITVMNCSFLYSIEVTYCSFCISHCSCKNVYLRLIVSIIGSFKQLKKNAVDKYVNSTVLLREKHCYPQCSDVMQQSCVFVSQRAPVNMLRKCQCITHGFL